MANGTAKRVVVAMSGGVDSSVAAAVLLEQGYAVSGAIMQLSPASEGEEDPAVADARRVAAQLDIPFRVMDFSARFQEEVIAAFIREYQQGRTPNPCVCCNRLLKFGAFLRQARAWGADYIATGHYARVTHSPQSGRYLLRRGADPAKDQAYVLHGLTQEQLGAAIFPLGEWSKEETRRRAAELRLPVAEKRDSQEICFVPNNNYSDFLRRTAPATACPGPIMTQDGRVLGEHPGISFYTLGQKRGLRLPLPYPQFVLEIRPETNTLVVGPEEALLQRDCLVEEVNWIAFSSLQSALPVQAKVRYNMREQPAIVSPLGENRVRLTFAEPQRAITPGQSAVFYADDMVLGGGVIRAVGLATGENG